MRTEVAAHLPVWWFDGDRSRGGKADKGPWKQLADGLAKVEAMNPQPGEWKHWASFSRKGAKAAREGDAGGVRSACRGCHKVYRRGYRRDYRTRKLPQ